LNFGHFFECFLWGFLWSLLTNSDVQFLNQKENVSHVNISEKERNVVWRQNEHEKMKRKTVNNESNYWRKEWWRRGWEW
jgi:hypothetical protein